MCDCIYLNVLLLVGGSADVCVCVCVLSGCGECVFVVCTARLVHVVFVGYRAQQCDLNPDLLRVLEDGYVSKCRGVTWFTAGVCLSMF